MKLNNWIFGTVLFGSGLICIANRTSKSLPVLLFQANSIAFDSIQDYSDLYKGIDSTGLIKCVIDIVKANPNNTLTLYGCFDATEKIKNLGRRRAEKIKNIFVKNGVSENKISIIVREGREGDYTRRQIDAMSNEKDREYYRRRNRKVIFTLEIK